LVNPRYVFGKSTNQSPVSTGALQIIFALR
jgi:hypothetical protein